MKTAVCFAFAAVCLAQAFGKDCPLYKCYQPQPCEFGEKLAAETGCPTCECNKENDATECQKKYAAAQKSHMLGVHAFKCDAFGEYESHQCFENSCTCVDKKGEPIMEWMEGPKGHSVRCDCLRQAKDAEGRIGSFMPRCDSDGRYQQVQCHGSTGFCWCVDQETGRQLSQPTRGKVESC